MKLVNYFAKLSVDFNKTEQQSYHGMFFSVFLSKFSLSSFLSSFIFHCTLPTLFIFSHIICSILTAIHWVWHTTCWPSFILCARIYFSKIYWSSAIILQYHWRSFIS